MGIPMLSSVSLFLLFPEWSGLFLLLVGIFLIFLAFFSKEERRKTLLCALSGIAISFCVMGLVGIAEHRLSPLCDKEVSVSGSVVSFSKDSYDLFLTKLDGKPFYKTMRVESNEKVNLGDQIRVSVEINSVFSEKERAEGIYLLATEGEDRVVIGKNRLYSFVGSIREKLQEAFLGEEVGGFLSAILLGDKSRISLWQEDFEKTASMHILAISGLHISQFISFFAMLFHLLPVRRRFVRILLFPLVGILFLLGGAGISVFRASFMTLFSLSALLMRRRGDSVTSLVFAACVLVILNPYTMESYSFLFSFLSTFAVTSCAVPLSEYFQERLLENRKKGRFFFRILAGVISSFIIASAVFVFLLPLQLILFGEAQLFSPLYALVLVPSFQVCLNVALFSAILVFLPISIPFLWQGTLLLQKGFLYLVTSLAKASPELISLEKYTVPTALFFLVALFVFFLRKEKLFHVFYLHLASFVIFLFCKIFLV